MAKRDRLVEELSDRYRIERELGRGGMAVVYLAHDERLDREVAIKVMRASPDSDGDTLPRLLREARTVGKLQHPNIVQIYDIRTLEEDGLALIMRYIPGKNLKQALRDEGPFSPERARQVLVDVADALEHAHMQRLVHRDVKPENIHIHEETGLALLSDFGIAREWGASSTLTMQGAALGTPAYMSPEQIDGVELDGRTDIYSLGLVGYEMLSGSAPFAGDTLFRVLERQRRELPPPLATVRDDVPEDLDRAIEVATLKDRDKRWSSARALADAIRTVMQHAPRATAPPSATPSPRPIPDIGEDAPTIMFRRGDDGLITEETIATPIPVGSKKRGNPRPTLEDFSIAATAATETTKPRVTEKRVLQSAAGRAEDLRSFVAVESDLDFQNALDMDPFLHCWEGTVRLKHLKCQGLLVVEPPQFEVTRRGKLVAAPSDPEDEVWLVCGGCEDRSEGIPRIELEVALKKFLSRPTPSALEIYPLGRESKLVPGDWIPPKRRRLTDRRDPGGRYDQDPSLLGKRRLGQDRRQHPEFVDFDPDEETDE